MLQKKRAERGAVLGQEQSLQEARIISDCYTLVDLEHPVVAVTSLGELYERTNELTCSATTEDAPL